MTDLLIAFVIPILVMIAAAILQTLIRCAFKVAAIIFIIVISVAFALGGTLLLIALAWVYTFIAFITAFIVSRFCGDENDNCCCGNRNSRNSNSRNLDDGECDRRRRRNDDLRCDNNCNWDDNVNILNRSNNNRGNNNCGNGNIGDWNIGDNNVGNCNRGNNNVGDNNIGDNNNCDNLNNGDSNRYNRCWRCNRYRV